MKFNLENSIFLDLTRGLSAQAVLIGHLYAYCIFDSDSFFHVHKFGVLIFFFLSGLLITYTTNLKGKDYGMKNYVIDRFARIFISYIPALFIIACLDFIAIKHNPNYVYAPYFNLHNFVGNLFMLENHPLFLYGLGRIKPLFSIQPFGSGCPLWTVSMEWWIYMGFGILFYKKLTYKNVFLWLILLSLPLYTMIEGPIGSTLIILWCFGSLSYFFLQKGFVHLKNIWLLVFVLILMAIIRLHITHNLVYDPTFGLLICVAIFLIIQDIQLSPSKYSKLQKVETFSRFLSSYSFSLYLIHFSIMSLVIDLKLGFSPWTQLLILFFVCNSCGWLLSIFTEKHNHVFRRFIKKRIIPA